MRYNILLIFIIISIKVSFTQSLWGQVISNKTRIEINAKGIKSTERIILIQVNSKQENWLSHIEVGHNPRQKFSFHYARIVDQNGNVLNKLSKKDLVTRHEQSYQSFYQDDLITEFDMYWNRYPYRVEYSYTITEEEYLYVVWWTPLLFANVPTLKSLLEIDVPSTYEVHLNQTGR